jgi:hypothetical protein
MRLSFFCPAFGIFDGIKSLGLRKERCRLKRRRYECNTGNRDCYWEICRAEEFVSQPQFRPSAADAAMILLHLWHD